LPSRQVTLPLVGSYPAFSPLPAEQSAISGQPSAKQCCMAERSSLIADRSAGGILSVALSRPPSPCRTGRRHGRGRWPL